jgi:Pretoxin HINT domain
MQTMGGDSNWATINDTTVTVGTGGATGVTTETASGNSQWDARTYSFSGTSVTTATLSGGPSNVIYPNLALQNWGGPTGGGGLLWTPGAALTATAGKLAVSSGGVLLGGPTTLAAPLPMLMMASGLAPMSPPVLTGIAAPTAPTMMWLQAPLGVLGYGLGGWIGPQANGLLNANLGLHLWNYLNSQQGGFWATVSGSFSDAAGKGQSSLGHLSMNAGVAFQSAAGRVGGVIHGDNPWAYLGYVTDFVGGILNTVTAGLAGRIVGWITTGFNWLTGIAVPSLVDASSAAYKAGEAAGQVVAVLLLATPFGWASLAIQAVGMAFNAEDAFARGDVAGGLLDLGGSLLAVVGAGEALEAADGAIGLAAESEAPALVEAEGLSGLESEAKGSLSELESGLSSEPGAALTEPNATAELPQEPLSDYTANSECQNPGECFTKEMLIKCERGKRPAYTIKEHDLIWSRNENNPTGPLELKEVQEVFTRVALICNVHVEGQVIRTTVEHPFFVLGKGWTPAMALKIGDMLTTPDGQLVPVEGVANSGAVETVYNWRIADHHTYFVSATEHGISVWAHNACTVEDARAAAQRHGGEEIGDGRFQFPNRQSARQAASELAGNLGSGARPIPLSEFEGGPWWTKNSNKVIGRESADGLVGWRDDFLGHPRFGAGPHVNVWGPGGAEFHLFY